MSKQAGKLEDNFFQGQEQGGKREDNFSRSRLENGGKHSKRSRTDAEIRIQYEADQDISSLRKKGKFEANTEDKRQLSEVASKVEANEADQEVAYFRDRIDLDYDL